MPVPPEVPRKFFITSTVVAVDEKAEWKQSMHMLVYVLGKA
jgi:hypothetical protein